MLKGTLNLASGAFILGILRPQCHPCLLSTSGRARTRILAFHRRLNSLSPTRFDKNVSNLVSQVHEPIALSKEQQRVLDLVLSGKSVFFTGSAGTGKSVLLRQIIQALRQDEDHQVAVTASTGIAAVNIGGVTLHSFAGLGLGIGSLQILIKRAQVNRSIRRRLRETTVLVIDENGQYFDVLDKVFQAIRINRRPFGGMQLVICGDFFQLPPVPSSRQLGEPEESSFAFEAESWNQAVPITIRLNQVFRQRQPEFINLLNDLREGIVSARSAKLLRGLSRGVADKAGIQPTELFPHRLAAEKANLDQMERLPGRTNIYEGKDKLGRDSDDNVVSKEWALTALDGAISKRIELKVGAQVMCTKNLTDTIVNGSIGIVVEFTKGRHPVVKFDNGEVMEIKKVAFEYQNEKGNMAARRTQIPLILAWALTIHKAQGQTLPRVKVNLARAFANGQAYVALSRCTTLQGLQVLGFSPRVVFCDPKVVEWSKRLVFA